MFVRKCYEMAVGVRYLTVRRVSAQKKNVSVVMNEGYV